jgi:hypothetical protein
MSALSIQIPESGPRTPKNETPNAIGSPSSQPNKSQEETVSIINSLDKILNTLWTPTAKDASLDHNETNIVKIFKLYKGNVKGLLKNTKESDYGSISFFKQLEMTREFYARVFLVLEKHRATGKTNEINVFNANEGKGLGTFNISDPDTPVIVETMIKESYERLVESVAGMNKAKRAMFHSNFNYELVPILEKFAEYEMHLFKESLFSNYLASDDKSEFGQHLNYLEYVNEITDTGKEAQKSLYETYPSSMKLSYAFYFPLSPQHNSDDATAASTTAVPRTPVEFSKVKKGGSRRRHRLTPKNTSARNRSYR